MNRWHAISAKLKVHKDLAREAFEIIHKRSGYSKDLAIVLSHIDADDTIG